MAETTELQTTVEEVGLEKKGKSVHTNNAKENGIYIFI